MTHDYLEPLEALADERPIVFYDQLGCGNSDRPGDPPLSGRWSATSTRSARSGSARPLPGAPPRAVLGGEAGSRPNTSSLKNPTASRASSSPGRCWTPAGGSPTSGRTSRRSPDEMQEDIREAEAGGNFDSPEYQEAITAYYTRHVCRTDPWPECLNRSIEHLAMPVYLQMWGGRASSPARGTPGVQRRRPARRRPGSGALHLRGGIRRSATRDHGILPESGAGIGARSL
ncbi:hypothetical protein [Methanoculleus chikugoensis]|uniref:hypothetical protein n=1 Tax=Methanoculleus chikugoensis TaxID=118126 RepID=UPI000B22EAED|nr:hypothetical protein [Methanoculleus chikugoensis]